LLPAALERDERAMFRDLAILASALVALTFIAYVWTIDWRGAIPRDGTTLAVGRDFLNLWMHGRAAAISDPGQFYDLATYHQAIRDLLGMELNGQNWSYSPSIMLLAAPFGQLSYLAAFACWTLIGVAVFVVVGRKLVADWRILIPVLLSPAALFCLICGPSSFLPAAMLMTIFAWLDRKPIAAGVLMMLALFLACSVSASPYLLAYGLLPLTFAAIALLACASLAAPGRRVVQLVCWTPVLQLALGTYYLPGPALIAPAFAVYLLMRLRVSAGVQAGLKRILSFGTEGFSRAKVALRSLRATPPLLYEAHRRNIASI
jgi:hypothetical protein